MSARILECSTAEYLADPCETPSLSSSVASTLIHRSPLHAWLEHPRLGGKPRRATKEMDRGSLIHSLLLDAGKGIEVVDAKDWRTKAAKEAKGKARSEGKTPVLRREFEAVERSVVAIQERIDDLKIELEGQAEIAVTWQERDSVGPVQCRAMLDLWIFEKARIIDVKTCVSSSPAACAKHVVDYGYAIQRAAYTAAIGALYPELAGRLDFLLLFCEVEEPHCVTAARLDGGLREIGEMHWRRAVDLWGRCLRSDQWPTYSNEIVMLEAPHWLLARELGEEV